MNPLENLMFLDGFWLLKSAVPTVLIPETSAWERCGAGGGDAQTPQDAMCPTLGIRVRSAEAYPVRNRVTVRTPNSIGIALTRHTSMLVGTLVIPACTGWT